MPHDVFISYSKKDKEIADAICSNLENNKIKCWYAPRDILFGENWGGAIIRAINKSQIFVLVFSSNSNLSSQVIKEVERAANKNIIIIPFKIEDVALSDEMEYFISTPHWLDAVTPPLQEHIDELLVCTLKFLDKENVLGNLKKAR